MAALNIESSVEAFARLGMRLSALSDETKDYWYQAARAQNAWFTRESVTSALDRIAANLQKAELRQWVKLYSFEERQPKKVGVVMAGNIPAAGFHDMLCVLLSGHILRARPSPQDIFLVKEIARLLTEEESAFSESINFTERLNDVDAIIVSGNDKSGRYFQQYFGQKPHIIRQNLTSCGILTGNEIGEELKSLGGDIFQYFGLGSRNVSKLFVPPDYNFDTFFGAIQEYAAVIHHHKYSNNYDYNKSVYLVNQIPHLDNGFLLLTQNESLTSPTAVVYYETYQDVDELHRKMKQFSGNIQCIVSQNGWFTGSIPFGEAQRPKVWDYAGGVDTMRFLLSL